MYLTWAFFFTLLSKNVNVRVKQGDWNHSEPQSFLFLLYFSIIIYPLYVLFYFHPTHAITHCSPYPWVFFLFFLSFCSIRKMREWEKIPILNHTAILSFLFSKWGSIWKQGATLFCFLWWQIMLLIIFVSHPSIFFSKPSKSVYSCCHEKTFSWKKKYLLCFFPSHASGCLNISGIVDFYTPESSPRPLHPLNIGRQSCFFAWVTIWPSAGKINQ